MLYGDEAIQMAEADGLPFDLIRAHIAVGTLFKNKGELHKATPVLERGLTLCQVGEVQIWFPVMASALASTYALSGRLDDALPLLEQAVEKSLAGQRPRRLLYLSEGYLLADRCVEAHTCAEHVLELSTTSKERGTQAWVLRLLGDIIMHRDPPEIDQAKIHYHDSLALANELGMRPLQAHCHRGLGTLYCQTGQSEQARAELSTAIDMYRDMEMTLWLPETEAVLEQLEGKA